MTSNKYSIFHQYPAGKDCEPPRKVFLPCLRPRAALWQCCLASLIFISPVISAAPINDMRESTVRVLCVNGEDVGTGSGFVVGDGEYIVTNFHVIECTDSGGGASIYLSSEEHYESEVVWKSPEKDLAILKLGGKLERPSVEFASGEAIEVGDKVLAAGFPGAADHEDGSEGLGIVSISEGIISRLSDQKTEGQTVKFFQISAPINPGNSGGPLFNEYGQVVGINAQKSLAMVSVIDPSAPNGTSMERVPLGEGIGWAIRAEELFPALDELGIDYDVADSKPNFLIRLWHRDPLILAVFLMVGALSLYTISLLSRRGNGTVTDTGTKSTGVISHSEPVHVPAPVVKKAVLRGISGPYADCVMELDGEPISIGRDPELCQLVMPQTESDIGRRHCQLQHDAANNVFILEDCGSVNGTFLTDGRKLNPGEKHRLKAGEGFYLSTPQYQFVVEV